LEIQSIENRFPAKTFWVIFIKNSFNKNLCESF